MVDREGFVYYDDCLAGVIKETEDGFQFAYFSSYLAETDAKPISLTLPLKKEPYESSTMFSFFDGLIPEGWLLTIATELYKLKVQDRMGILLTCCEDCVGAVSVYKKRK